MVDDGIFERRIHSASNLFGMANLPVSLIFSRLADLPTSRLAENLARQSLALPLSVNADTTLQLVGASRKLAKVHRQRL